MFSAAVKNTSEYSSLCRGFRLAQEKYLYYCASTDEVLHCIYTIGQQQKFTKKNLIRGFNFDGNFRVKYMFRFPLLEYSLWTISLNLACLDGVQFYTKFT